MQSLYEFNYVDRKEIGSIHESACEQESIQLIDAIYDGICTDI